MTTEMITCPKCSKEMPKHIIGCWNCGEPLSPKLRKISGKEPLEKAMKSGRNQSFFGREKRLLKWRNQR